MQLNDVIDSRYAVFNKERFKRYALFFCQGMSWRLNDLIDWLEEDNNEAQNRSSRARGKQKAAPKRRSARK